MTGLCAICGIAAQALRENSELRDAILKARTGESLNESESFLVELENRSTLIDFQYIYLEYRQGLLDEEEIFIDAWRRVFRDNPGMREYWQTQNSNYRPQFVQWMEENIVNER